MKSVGSEHQLMLDINTDESHLLHFGDDKPLLTFDSSTVCRDASGAIICRLSVKENHWFATNSLGIVLRPVSSNKMEGVFESEAEFCLKWLELNHIEA